ncbi:hypothetical protein JCM4814A_81490 [Streptomyces phaeofaciens JCM 4814]|uniref:Uncharacterized protein n=1 Tax=Streptomyces phaeofaciens TaxID=68254 RepID=A0A918HP17_9ACTN|nr:hypothetical protein GCM10010226_79520 [Streptomyces phaeofaciens]
MRVEDGGRGSRPASHRRHKGGFGRGPGGMLRGGRGHSVRVGGEKAAGEMNE